MYKSIKRFIYLGGIYSIGSILEKALSFFFIPLYTTYLGTSDYGIVGLMSITIGLISKFITPPITSGFVRHYYAPDYKDKKGLLLYNSFILLSIQSVVLAMLFYLFRSVISDVVLGSRELIYLVQVYALILLLNPLSQFLLTFLRQIEKAKLFIFISWARFLVSAGVILTGLIYLKIGVLALIYGNLIGIIITIVFILPVFWKYSIPKISLSVLGPPLKYGYPLILSGFSMLLIGSGDRYVLKIFSSLSNVGLYTFGYNFAGIMLIFLITPLKNALNPITFKQENKPEQLRNFLKKNCTYFYFIGMFFCLFLSLYSKEAIQIMARKEEFWGSWVIVPIIAFSHLQHGLGSFVGQGLTMAKKSFNVSGNVLIAAVVNIGLNFVFIPYWGILGAAFATLISYFVWNSLKVYYSAKFYDLYFDLKRLAYITIVGVGLYLMSLYITNVGNLYIAVSIKFLILLSYPIIFFVTGFFTPKEREYTQKLWTSIRTNGLRETYTKIRAI